MFVRSRFDIPGVMTHLYRIVVVLLKFAEAKVRTHDTAMRIRR